MERVLQLAQVPGVEALEKPEFNKKAEATQKKGGNYNNSNIMIYIYIIVINNNIYIM